MAKKRSATRQPKPPFPKQHQPKPPFPKQHQPKPGRESKLRPRPAFEAPLYRPAGKLEQKIAIITGGDSGIGRAVAVMFAREGADVVISCLPTERADAAETERHITALGRKAVIVPGDLRRTTYCTKLVRAAIREFGKIDILVNNAAFQTHQESLGDVSSTQLRRTVETNIYGMFELTKAALEHMKPGSAIINTGSETGIFGNKALLDYSSTKGAIHAFTKSLAQALVDRKIRVNCVAPGPVWTPLNPSDQPASKVAVFGKDTPMGRPAQPEEIAPAFVFLASNADSSYITGEVIAILGGETAP